MHRNSVAETYESLVNGCPELRAFHIPPSKREIAWESTRNSCVLGWLMADGDRTEARSFPLSCFTSISGLFTALCPFYAPKGPLRLRRLPPCPSPRRIPLRHCPPHAYFPGIPLQIALMNSLAARNTAHILQLTDGLAGSRYSQLTCIVYCGFSSLSSLLPLSLRRPFHSFLQNNGISPGLHDR